MRFGAERRERKTNLGVGQRGRAERDGQYAIDLLHLFSLTCQPMCVVGKEGAHLRSPG